MVQLRMILTGFLAAALSIGATDSALADASRGGNSSATPRDSQYAEAERAVKRGDYPAAIRLLEGVVAKDQRNADAYNLLAYSIRKSGDPGKSIPIYEKALAIDPKHKGAHEYIGEAYLALGDLDKAKQHLAILDKLCLFPCEEYTDLKKAVQAYESGGGQVKPTSQTKP
jgi:tetratricopeptide (TPR) repeat protein